MISQFILRGRVCVHMCVRVFSKQYANIVSSRSCTSEYRRRQVLWLNICLIFCLTDFWKQKKKQTSQQKLLIITSYKVLALFSLLTWHFFSFDNFDFVCHNRFFHDSDDCVTCHIIQTRVTTWGLFELTYNAIKNITSAWK